MLFFTKKG